jgi:protein N-terminal glutamine amidohydrolase
VTPFDHAPLYCEENILRLCGRREFASPGAVVAVISNAARRVHMREQRSGHPFDGSLLWDYHVIGLRCGATGWEVWDLESRLGLPAPALRYLKESFVDPAPDPPLFRIVDAETYARELRSDRSHMRRADGSWTAAPPPWPAPVGRGGVGLWSLVDMETAGLGRVVTLDECRKLYGGI